MCGIVGYTGKRTAAPVVLEGLKRLEYRGYDSAGLAVVNGGLEVFRAPGKIAVLERELGTNLPPGTTAIAQSTAGEASGDHRARQRRLNGALSLPAAQGARRRPAPSLPVRR